MYDVDLSTILNLAFESTQDDNNHLHLSAIRIDAQEAINYAAVKMKKYYNSHHQSKFFQIENTIVIA